MTRYYGFSFAAGALVAAIGFGAFTLRRVERLEQRFAPVERWHDGAVQEEAELDRGVPTTSERRRLAAQAAYADAVSKCRSMRQVAVAGTDGRVVCLQAPSVAFELDPTEPQ